MKSLKELIVERDEHLYWAFGLVAGAWSISLLISLVVHLVGTKVISKKIIPVAKIGFEQFNSDSTFRHYLKDAGWWINNARVNQLMSDLIMPLEEKIQPDELLINEQNQITSYNFQKDSGVELAIRWGQYVYLTNLSKGQTEILRLGSMGKISRMGNLIDYGGLLEVNGNMVVINDQEIMSYNLDIPASLEKRWSYQLKGGSKIRVVKSLDNKLLVILGIKANHSMSCPIPLIANSTTVADISCQKVMYLKDSIEADVIYALLIININTGEVEKKTALVGSSASQVKIDNGYVEIGFPKETDTNRLLVDFFNLPQTILIDQITKDKLRKVMIQDLSEMAKRVEIEQILDNYQDKTNDVDRLSWVKDRNRLLNDYINSIADTMNSGYIAKINLNDLTVLSVDKTNNARMSSGTVLTTQLGQTVSFDEWIFNINPNFVSVRFKQEEKLVF